MYALGHDIYYYDRYCLIYGYYKCSAYIIIMSISAYYDYVYKRAIKSHR